MRVIRSDTSCTPHITKNQKQTQPARTPPPTRHTHNCGGIKAKSAKIRAWEALQPRQRRRVSSRRVGVCSTPRGPRGKRRCHLPQRQTHPHTAATRNTRTVGTGGAMQPPQKGGEQHRHTMRPPPWPRVRLEGRCPRGPVAAPSRPSLRPKHRPKLHTAVTNPHTASERPQSAHKRGQQTHTLADTLAGGVAGGGR